MNLLDSADELTKLARLRRSTLLKIRGVGKKYADQIQAWQKQANFSSEVDYVGDMIVEDAHRLLTLHDQIQNVATKIKATLVDSEMGQILQSVSRIRPYLLR